MLGVDVGIGWWVNCRGAPPAVGVPALNDPELPFSVDPRLGVDTAAATAADILPPLTLGPEDEPAAPTA
jgi:hypothetical protein